MKMIRKLLTKVRVSLQTMPSNCGVCKFYRPNQGNGTCRVSPPVLAISQAFMAVGNVSEGVPEITWVDPEVTQDRHACDRGRRVTHDWN